MREGKSNKVVHDKIENPASYLLHFCERSAAIFNLNKPNLAFPKTRGFWLGLSDETKDFFDYFL